MGLRDFLKKHEDDEDKDVIFKDEDGEESINVGNAFRALKKLKNRKS